MCRRRVESESGGILDYGAIQDFVPEIEAEIACRAKIGLPSNDSGQLNLHFRKSYEAGYMFGIEFDEKVHIAVVSKVAAQYGAEEGKFPDMVSAAKRCGAFPVYIDG